MKIRTKIEIGIIVSLMLVTSIHSVFGDITITDNSMTDDTYGTIIDYDNNWINITNMTIGDNIGLSAPSGTTSGSWNGSNPYIHNSNGKTWTPTGSNIQRVIDNTTDGGYVVIPFGNYSFGSFDINRNITVLGQYSTFTLTGNEQIEVYNGGRLLDINIFCDNTWENNYGALCLNLTKNTGSQFKMWREQMTLDRIIIYSSQRNGVGFHINATSTTYPSGTMAQSTFGDITIHRFNVGFLVTVKDDVGEGYFNGNTFTNIKIHNSTYLMNVSATHGASFTGNHILSLLLEAEVGTIQGLYFNSSGCNNNWFPCIKIFDWSDATGYAMNILGNYNYFSGDFILQAYISDSGTDNIFIATRGVESKIPQLEVQNLDVSNDLGVTGSSTFTDTTGNIIQVVSSDAESSANIKMTGKRSTDTILGQFIFTNSYGQDSASIVVNRDGANNSAEIEFNVRNNGVWLYEQLKIDSNGFVAINKTTPEYELDVTGDIHATGSFIGANYTMIWNGDNNTFKVTEDGTGMVYYFNHL